MLEGPAQASTSICIRREAQAQDTKAANRKTAAGKPDCLTLQTTLDYAYCASNIDLSPSPSKISRRHSLRGSRAWDSNPHKNADAVLFYSKKLPETTPQQIVPWYKLEELSYINLMITR